MQQLRLEFLLFALLAGCETITFVKRGYPVKKPKNAECIFKMAHHLSILLNLRLVFLVHWFCFQCFMWLHVHNTFLALYKMVFTSTINKHITDTETETTINKHMTDTETETTQQYSPYWAHFPAERRAPYNPEIIPSFCILLTIADTEYETVIR